MRSLGIGCMTLGLLFVGGKEIAQASTVNSYNDYSSYFSGRQSTLCEAIDKLSSQIRINNDSEIERIREMQLKLLETNVYHTNPDEVYIRFQQLRERALESQNNNRNNEVNENRNELERIINEMMQTRNINSSEIERLNEIIRTQNINASEIVRIIENNRTQNIYHYELERLNKEFDRIPLQLPSERYNINM